MNLSELMNSVSIFDAVDYSKTRETEICLGRVRQGNSPEDTKANEDAWFNMVYQTLVLQIKGKKDAVSFSKQYLIRDDELIYFWKVVCRDIDWLDTNMPRLDKTVEWQREAVNETGLSEGKKGEVWGRMSLPGVSGKLELGPQPEDIGQLSDAKSENR